MSGDNIRNTFIVNGQEYSSLDEVPEEFRSLMADMPMAGQPIGSVRYEVSRRKFSRLEDIPEEFKGLLEGKNGNGIPGNGEKNRKFPIGIVETNEKRSDSPEQAVSRKYFVNGCEYASVDELPEGFRGAFHDILDTKGFAEPAMNKKTVTEEFSGRFDAPKPPVPPPKAPLKKGSRSGGKSGHLSFFIGSTVFIASVVVLIYCLIHLAR
jgi:hypothetical protein